MAHPTAHVTLAANEVETIAIDTEDSDRSYRVVAVAVEEGSAWYTLDGEEPAVGADGSYFVTATVAAVHTLWQASFTVKAVSSTSTRFSVMPY